MFNTMPDAVRDRMEFLEELDLQDRGDGTPHLKRLRQVPSVTGKFLAMMAANAPDQGAFLEIGTSGGYSALWITRALADRKDTRLVTFELLKEKAELARETFKTAKVESLIELINGDARGHVGEFEEVAFCFLDCEKEMYPEVYDLVIPNLVTGGIFIADNATSHADDLQEFIDKAEHDHRVDAMVVTVGKGLLVCRKY